MIFQKSSKNDQFLMVFWPFFGEKRDFQSSNHFFDLAGRDFLMILGKRSKNDHFFIKKSDFEARFWSSIFHPTSDFSGLDFRARFWSKIMLLKLDFGARFAIQKISKSDEIFGSPKISKSHQILSDFLKSHWSLRILKF